MPANPLRGEAMLTAGPDEYKLVFDANAFCYAQQTLGMKAMEMVAAFSEDPDDMLTMRGLLWAGLQKHHECHLIQAGEVLSSAGMPEARAAIALGLAAAFGTETKGDKEQKKAATTPKTPGTGSPSTRNTAKRAAAR